MDGMVECPKCNGSGTIPHSPSVGRVTCHICDGEKRLEAQQAVNKLWSMFVDLYRRVDVLESKARRRDREGR